MRSWSLGNREDLIEMRKHYKMENDALLIPAFPNFGLSSKIRGKTVFLPFQR